MYLTWCKFMNSSLTLDSYYAELFVIIFFPWIMVFMKLMNSSNSWTRTHRTLDREIFYEYCCWLTNPENFILKKKNYLWVPWGRPSYSLFREYHEFHEFMLLVLFGFYEDGKKWSFFSIPKKLPAGRSTRSTQFNSKYSHTDRSKKKTRNEIGPTANCACLCVLRSFCAGAF